MARRRSKSPVVFLTGTYTEFMGKKSLPKAFSQRPILFLLGPSGSGKTMVSRQLMGTETNVVRQQQILELLSDRILFRTWDVQRLFEPAKLILEIPCFIEHRPQIMLLLVELLQIRANSNKRTAVLDSEDNASIQSLLKAIPAQWRASIVLRFPEGKGRYRFLAHRCKERGIPLRHARSLAKQEPWSYKSLFGTLEKIEKQLVKELLSESDTALKPNPKAQ